jgi:hypothetical protein
MCSVICIMCSRRYGYACAPDYTYTNVDDVGGLGSPVIGEISGNSPPSHLNPPSDLHMPGKCQTPSPWSAFSEPIADQMKGLEACRSFGIVLGSTCSRCQQS